MTAAGAGAGGGTVVVVGGGRAGTAIARQMRRDGDLDPLVLDTDYDRLRCLRDAGIACAHVSGTDIAAVATVLRGAAGVICAAPPSVAVPVARAANAAGCHYVDMCEDLSVTARVAAEATAPGLCFAPGCGLAPGLVSALVEPMLRDAPAATDIIAYAGVLPATKTNRLGYGNLWGIDGLMAEYTNPCQAIETGRIVARPPLDGLERIEIGGERFEAFTTAGSLDDLAQHHAGRVAGLAFKTLRYPGHLDYVRFLLDDLRLSERPYMFRNLLMNGLSPVERDRVVIHIADRNPENPRLETVLFDPPNDAGEGCSAASAAAAHHVCAVMDILVRGLVPAPGVLHHTDLTLDVLDHSRHWRAFLTADPSPGPKP